MHKNFEQFYKKMQKTEGLVPSIFEKVAKKAGIKFVNEAKDLTDKEKLVDTGNYKRNWHTDIGNPGGKFWVVKCMNSVEYASWLEYGYPIEKNRFIPFDKMEGTPKTKAFIAKIKSKYPNAKGFMLHAGKVKGKFIGKQAKEKAEQFAIDELTNELGDLFKK